MNGCTQSIAYYLALHRTTKLSLKKIYQLLDHFDTVEDIFTTDRQTLGQFALKGQAIDDIKNPDWTCVEKDLNWLTGSNHHLVTIDSPAYPFYLKQISHPPFLLFVDGDVELLSSYQISIVGSRNPTAAGKCVARDFAANLSEKGFTITSGLALGIDQHSHIGALESSGKTIAVLGNGIDTIYPARNRELASKIKETGAVISEFPPATPPLPQNFPQRNRIISGLSMGTLVVEAARRSGSLITARLANEQGREVFAIPGSILNPMSSGCHSLLKEGAKLTETADDIVQELLPHLLFEHQSLDTRELNQRGADNLDQRHLTLLEMIGFDPISIDSIVEQSGLTTEEVSSMLLDIELGGHIQSQLGGSFIRITKT